MWINVSIFVPEEAQQFTNAAAPTFKLGITTLYRGQTVDTGLQDFTYGNVIFGAYSNFRVVIVLEPQQQADTLRISLLSADGNTQYYSAIQNFQLSSNC